MTDHTLPNKLRNLMVRGEHLAVENYLRVMVPSFRAYCVAYMMLHLAENARADVVDLAKRMWLAETSGSLPDSPPCERCGIRPVEGDQHDKYCPRPGRDDGGTR